MEHRSEDWRRYLGEVIYVSTKKQQQVQKHQLQSILGMFTFRHRGQGGRNEWQGMNASERSTDSYRPWDAFLLFI